MAAILFPLLTFKAGRCDVTDRKVKPVPTPGYLYLYSQDDLLHLCWRPRAAPASDPVLDLIAIPGDATFQPLVKDPGAEDVRSPTTGRIFCLHFSSSNEKQYFWMQSKTQHREGDTNWFSQRDQRLGQIVDLLLSGEEVDVQQEIEDIRQNGTGGDDTDMMDLDRQDTGGAGPDATGADPRDEGETSREGGADGGRATSSTQPQDTDAIVQNFLNSLKTGSGGRQQPSSTPSTTLPDLLTKDTSITYISTASAEQIDNLCTLLPPELFLLAQEPSGSLSSSEATPAVVKSALEALSIDQKKDILRRVLRSPQLHQSLGSLTVALRDGGLPMIGDALGLRIENGGLIKGGSMPLGGGEAVEAFIEGVRTTVQSEERRGPDDSSIEAERKVKDEGKEEKRDGAGGSR